MTARSERLPTFKLNEDWLATIAGLVIALIIGLGLLGPGSQTVTLSAEGGKNAARPALAIGGWSASATIGGIRATLADAPRQLEQGKTYVITCKDGALSAAVAETLPDGLNPVPADRAQLALANTCAEPVSLTFTSRPIVPYPLFRIF